jgi:glutamine synthetase type III
MVEGADYTMANLKHLQIDNDDPLNSYYITLCHVYYFHVSDDNSESEKQKADDTIETICSLLFHAINIEGTTIREMDNEIYVKQYKRFYNDIIDAIQECSKNEVDFEVFLEIIDEIIGAATTLANAFNKLQSVKEEYIEEEEVEEDSEE